MSFNIDDLLPYELDFYNRKNDVSKEKILKHLNRGLSFDNAVITEAQESFVSYHNWAKNNVKDEDKHIIDEWDNSHQTNYTGTDLTNYEKQIFDKLPNAAKWQVENNSRMWKAIEHAQENLIELIYNKLYYLFNPLNNT